MHHYVLHHMRVSMLSALVAGVAIVFASPAEARPRVAPNSSGEVQWTLTLDIRIGEEKTTDARVQIMNAAGDPFWPVDPNIPTYEAWTGQNYFYAPGIIDVAVDAGQVRIVVSHGPEFAIYDNTVTVSQDQTVLVSLTKLVDLPRIGWYSGDTHVHIAHGGSGAVYTLTDAEIAQIGRAEDLGLTCVLSNGPYFTGGLSPLSTPRNHLHFAMEYRSALFGHMGVLGLNSLLPFGCCLPWEAPWPMNLDVLGDADAQQATVVYSHPVPMDPSLMNIDDADWPYSGFARELPVDLILGDVDALDIFSYSNLDQNVARELWFDMLNLGFRLPLSVGTDASANRIFDPPPGGYRVYVKLPTPTFDLDQWLAGLRAGNSFATNGPLPYIVTLNNSSPGATLDVSGNHPVTLSGHVFGYTQTPLTNLEIYRNGKLLSSLALPAHTNTINFSFPVTVPPEDGWIVFRLVGSAQSPATVGLVVEAITSPIYLDGKDTMVSSLLIDEYVDWISLLFDLVLARPNADPVEMNLVLSRLFDAGQLLRGHTEDGGEDFLDIEEFHSTGSDSPPEVAFSRSPSGHRIHVAGIGEGRVELFDVAGRRVYVTDERPLPAQFDLSHGIVASGVYFARVHAEDRVLTTRRLTLLPRP